MDSQYDYTGITGLIVALNPYLVPIIGLVMAWGVWKIGQLEKNTNSIKDQLVKATEAKALVVGEKIGADKAIADQALKDAGIAEGKASQPAPTPVAAPHPVAAGPIPAVIQLEGKISGEVATKK